MFQQISVFRVTFKAIRAFELYNFEFSNWNGFPRTVPIKRTIIWSTRSALVCFTLQEHISINIPQRIEYQLFFYFRMIFIVLLFGVYVIAIPLHKVFFVCFHTYFNWFKDYFWNLKYVVVTLNSSFPWMCCSLNKQKFS